MTPEQKKIQELERQLREAQKSQELLKGKLQKSEEKLQKAEETISKKVEKIKNLEVKISFSMKADKDLFLFIARCLIVLKEKCPSDAEFQKIISTNLARDAIFTAENLAMEKFIRRAFLKKSEKITYPATKEDLIKGKEEAINEAKPALRDIQSRSAQVGRALTIAGVPVVVNAEKSNDASLKAAAVLSTFPFPETKDPLKGISLGRQSLPYEPVTEEAEETHIKCSCGNETDFISGAIRDSAIRSIEKNLHEMVHTIASRTQHVRCCKCGRVHAIYSDGDVPVTPTSSMGTSTTVAAAVLNASGIPLNKVEDILFNDDAKLGHETLGRNINKMCHDGFKLLHDAIIKTMGEQPVLIADETVYTILQSQGKGVCKPEEKTRQVDYIAAVCSPATEEKRGVIFSHLGGRGSQGISENLNQFNPRVLVTDAYPVYDKYCEEKSIQHQCCLAHLRRELLDAVNIETLVKELSTASDDEAFARAKRGFENQPHIYKICCVIQGISKIYAYEAEVERSPEEPLEKYFERVKVNRQRYAKELFLNIDLVMESLRDECTKQHGTKYVGLRNDQLSKAVTYYMNHRENFQVFLDEPRVTLDSNAVESVIRAVAVLRKSTDFKQSIDYTEGLCILLSLTESAKANKLNNPIEWLTDFSIAYFLHRASNTLTYEVQNNGKSLDSKLMEFRKGSEEGFDIEPWLPWNYVKRKQAS